MKESTLLKIALICSLAGLFILYFISIRIEPKDYKPDITSKNVGENVKLTGKIEKIREAQGAVFVDIIEQSPLTVVAFGEDNNLKLKKGDNIEVIGEIQEYKGKKEIIAQKIRVIK